MSSGPGVGSAKDSSTSAGSVPGDRRTTALIASPFGRGDATSVRGDSAYLDGPVLWHRYLVFSIIVFNRRSLAGEAELLIGAHVSGSGGVDRAIDRALEIGAECVQLFPSPPQGWGFKMPDEVVIAEFRRKVFESGIGPNVFHGIYLVSLGSDDPALVQRGKASLAKYLDVAADLGVTGVIFHLNSHKGRGFDGVFGQVTEAIREVLSESPDDVQLIIENSAGMGNHIGSKFTEIGAFIRELDDPRVQVCLDTQHSFAAGYDLRTTASVEGVMAEFDREIGLQHLVAVHCNDSKPDLGGALDRHENIGEGRMGIGAFEAILAHPAFAEIPFYLEVPGFEGNGPDSENVATMKSIREKVGQA